VTDGRAVGRGPTSHPRKDLPRGQGPAERGDEADDRRPRTSESVDCNALEAWFVQAEVFESEDLMAAINWAADEAGCFLRAPSRSDKSA